MKTIKGFILGVISTFVASIVVIWMSADDKVTSKVVDSALSNIRK